MAVPFVQGRLTDQFVSAEITTSCAQSGRPIHLTVDSDMGFTVHDDGADLLIFTPDIDWHTFTEPNIIHAF